MPSWNRRDAFDYALETTANILSHGDVVDALGEHALRLSKTVNGLFLPIANDGVASLPTEQMLSDEFALLPHTDSELETGLTLDGTLLIPTAKRFWQVVRFFGEQQGCNKQAAVEAELALMNNVVNSRNSVPVNLADKKATMTTCTVTDPDCGLMYRTRPIIHTSVQRIQKADPYQLAGTICHEIVHGEDYENALVQNTYDTAFHARTELRAYHIGATIRAVGGVLEGDGKTQAVEALRLRHVDPDAPFEPTTDLITLMQELGVID